MIVMTDENMYSPPIQAGCLFMRGAFCREGRREEFCRGFRGKKSVIFSELKEKREREEFLNGV